MSNLMKAIVGYALAASLLAVLYILFKFISLDWFLNATAPTLLVYLTMFLAFFTAWGWCLNEFIKQLKKETKK